ncbi:segregation/condensation protein A [Micrococcales bacterium 31B]|nr:segregation/condensation protein A [Micrococcales bacterium 31B]
MEPPNGEGQPKRHFRVHLDNFDGPFDLLLTLIGKHELPITDVALAQVTDEFIGYLRVPGWNLSEVSEFVMVAATLLDLKAARLLPQGEVADEADIALLEARDLLFARLLQYRAYKRVAAEFHRLLEDASLAHPRVVELEPDLAAVLPELLLAVSPAQLAEVAARALAPKPPPPGVGLAHLHAPVVSVREQASWLALRLHRDGLVDFTDVAAESESLALIVGRFLAALELYRAGLVRFEQPQPLERLTLEWLGTAADAARVHVDDFFDLAAAQGDAQGDADERPDP